MCGRGIVRMRASGLQKRQPTRHGGLVAGELGQRLDVNRLGPLLSGEPGDRQVRWKAVDLLDEGEALDLLLRGDRAAADSLRLQLSSEAVGVPSRNGEFCTLSRTNLTMGRLLLMDV